jgi:curved DNA-binding protein
MAGEHPFIDYYSILQVHPRCDAKILESAYHELLKLHHPDHTGSAETFEFNRVVEAYKVLRSPDRRTEYDRLHAEHRPEDWSGPADKEPDGTAALDDAEDHARILMYLYRKRRENAQDAGVVGYYIQQMLNCSDETFEFHKWYLKEKGFIVVTEHGTMAITIEGIDQVISSSRREKAERLLITQFRR